MRTVFSLFNFRIPTFYLVVFLPFVFVLGCKRPNTKVIEDEAIFYLKANKTQAYRDSLLAYIKENMNYLDPLEKNNVTLDSCRCDANLISIHAKGIVQKLFDGSGGGQVQKPPEAAGSDLDKKFAGMPSYLTGNVNSFVANIEFSEPRKPLSSFSSNPNSTKYQEKDTVYTAKLPSNINGSGNIGEPRIIAILDGGLKDEVDLNLPYIWKNPLENATDLIDNDGNNMINDMSGWNFVDNSNNPVDNVNPHGNNVAAFLAKELINNSASNTKLMILKVLDKENKGNLFDIMCAILYAYQNNADVLNMSLGYYGQNSELFSTFMKASNFNHPKTNQKFKDRWVVTAAGNTNTEADKYENHFGNKRDLMKRKNKFYPAFYAKDFENVFAVTTIDSTDNIKKVADDQNYSNKVVDIGVLGNAGPFFLDSGDNGHWGSSYATPIFTGLLTKFSTNTSTPLPGAPSLLKSVIITSISSKIKNVSSLSSRIKGKKYILYRK